MVTKTTSDKLKHKETNNKSKLNKDQNTTLSGGLEPKDDPDKLDKDDFESEEEQENDDNVEETEEIEEVEDEEEEKEEFNKEKEEDDDNTEDGDSDQCVYKLTKKKNTIDVDIEDIAEDNFEDEENFEDSKKDKYVKPSERKTKPFLFDFERVRILGERARQLSLGAKPMIKDLEHMNPKDVARLELKNKVIPLIILRELPNGDIEKWKVSELNF